MSDENEEMSEVLTEVIEQAEVIVETAEIVADEAETVASEEPEEMRFPRAIDVKSILQPLAGENPSGENLRYSGLYDAINEARRADEDLAQGDWQTDLKIADFRKVIDLSVPALSSQTKDLQIAAYLGEALVKEYQFVGLRDSLKLMSGLQERFWETIYPEIEEGDMEGRANAIAWMDAQAAFAVKSCTITQGEGYNFLDWEDSKRFDIPDNIDTLELSDQQKYRDLMALAEKERRTTAEFWKKAVIVSRRAFYEDLSVLISECWAEFKEINRVIEIKFDAKQMPGMSNLKKSLEMVETQVNLLLALKRLEEPDEVDTGAEFEDEDNPGAVKGSSGTSGAISSRADALRRLAQLAEYFRKTEPHSPISYLVTRAVKWGNMPLETWLQDVIKDETVLFQIRQTLGFNTGTADAAEEPQTAVQDDGQ